jgi:two-component system response regulator FixJ
MQPIVHVIDDDPSTRNSLRALLESIGLEAQVYPSAEDFLLRLEGPHHGCALIDLRLPGMNGIDLLRHLRQTKNDIPAIIISGNADVPAAIQIMKLGAIDVLEKPFDSNAILEVVNAALNKSGLQLQQLREHEKIEAVFAKLSPRERELLRLIVLGKSNKQIAIHLKIAAKTVINHRAHVMAKTNALNGADLARMATIAEVFKQERGRESLTLPANNHAGREQNSIGLICSPTGN